MELQELVRPIVEQVIAESGNAAATPDLISPATLVERHKDVLSRDLVYDLVRNSDTNGFPCARLSPRNIVIDYRRFVTWLANGGIGGKCE